MSKGLIVTKIKINEKEKEELNLLAKGEMLPIVKTRVDKFGNSHDIVYQRRITYSGARMRLRELYGGGFCRKARVYRSIKLVIMLEIKTRRLAV